MGRLRLASLVPPRADVLLALVVGTLSVANIRLIAEYEGAEFTTSAVVFAVIGSALVAFRRVAPIPVLVVAALLQTVVWSTAVPDSVIALSVLLYSVVVHDRRGRNAAVIVLGLLAVFTGLGVLSGDVGLEAEVALLSVGGLAIALGLVVSAQRSEAASARASIAEAERRSEAERKEAVEIERNRIARELHDVVAHGLALIVVQSQAAQRTLARDPDRAAEALALIETTGRTTLGEMRQILGALRDEDDHQDAPTPDLTRIEELLEDVRRAGLDVALVDRRRGAEVSTATSLGAYRIVQEALTNAVRHAGPGARATLELDDRADRLAISVVDDGRGAAVPHSGGHGLTGMQERVEVLGGSFRAGPRSGGGYAVRVTLPLTRATARA